MPDEQGYSFDAKTGQVQEVEEERGDAGPDLGEKGGFAKSANPEDQDGAAVAGGQGGWSEPEKGGLEKTGSGEQDPMRQTGGGQSGG